MEGYGVIDEIALALYFLILLAVVEDTLWWGKKLLANNLPRVYYMMLVGKAAILSGIGVVVIAQAVSIYSPDNLLHITRYLRPIIALGFAGAQTASYAYRRGLH